MVTNTVPKHLHFILWRAFSCNGEISQMTNRMSSEFMSLFLIRSLNFFFIVYLLWLFCPLAAAFTLYTCAHFSHFVFYGVFYVFPNISQMEMKEESGWRKQSEVVQKRKSEVINLWLKSFQWLTMNLVLFCCPDVRGGLIDFGVGFFSTIFSKTKQKLVCVSSLCWWICSIHLLYNSLLLKKILYNQQGFCGFVFQAFITTRDCSQCSSSIITLVQKGKMQFLKI